MCVRERSSDVYFNWLSLKRKIDWDFVGRNEKMRYIGLVDANLFLISRSDIISPNLGNDILPSVLKIHVCKHQDEQKNVQIFDILFVYRHA